MQGVKLLGLVVFLGALGALTMYAVDCERSGPRAQCHAKHGDFMCMNQVGCVCLKPGTVLSK